MRAVSPGRAAILDTDTGHGRLYVAMAEKFLDHADIVAPSSGCVTDFRFGSQADVDHPTANGPLKPQERTLGLGMSALTAIWPKADVAK